MAAAAPEALVVAVVAVAPKARVVVAVTAVAAAAAAEVPVAGVAAGLAVLRVLGHAYKKGLATAAWRSLLGKGGRGGATDTGCYRCLQSAD